MPSKQSHLAEAEENSNFADIISNELRNKKDLDKPENWIVTAKFYAAVHYVDAVLGDSSLHPDSHSDRFELIRQRRDFSPLAETLYETLYDLSMQSRYKCVKMTQGKINQSNKALKRLKSELDLG